MWAGAPELQAKPRKKPTPHESKLQAALVEWFDDCVPPEAAMLFAVANGGDRHTAVAARLTAEGVRRGVSDLVLMLPAGRTIFIEVKLAKTHWHARTVQSEEQLAFEERACALGHRYVVVRSIDELEALLRAEGVPLRTRTSLGWAQPRAAHP